MENKNKDIIVAGNKTEVKGVILTAGIKDFVISKRSMEDDLVEYRIEDNDLVRTILIELSKGNKDITIA